MSSQVYKISMLNLPLNFPKLISRETTQRNIVLVLEESQYHCTCRILTTKDSMKNEEEEIRKHLAIKMKWEEWDSENEKGKCGGIDQ